MNPKDFMLFRSSQMQLEASGKDNTGIGWVEILMRLACALKYAPFSFFFVYSWHLFVHILLSFLRPGHFLEDTVFPTLTFPSDHGILSMAAKLV